MPLALASAHRTLTPQIPTPKIGLVAGRRSKGTQRCRGWRVIAVVHLVWGPLGPAPLREFLRSYNACEAGTPHELVVVFNGVASRGEGIATRDQGEGTGTGDRSEGAGTRNALMAELQGTPHRLIAMEHPVLDLVAYERAARTLDHEYICMLNSHSRLRAVGWLALLEEALHRPNVGLVGATGSWASMRSYALRQLGLPSAYRRVWAARSRTFEEFQELHGERTGEPSPRSPLALLHTARALADMTIGFSQFPAPHIRTNAFMAERERLRQALSRRLRRKVDAHRLESGRRSITSQIERAGLRALVVDSSGRSYETPEWPDSKTFWQADQEGLLVADNQTDTYRHADGARRRLLAQYAWGERAAPSEPGL